MPRPIPGFSRVTVLAIGLFLVASSPVRAAGSWDVIVPSLMNTTMCVGCGISFGGAALLVNTGPGAFSASDLASMTFDVQSSSPDFTFYLSKLNEGLVAPVAPGEAVGFVSYLDNGTVTPNDIFVDYVGPSETFRNTDPVGLMWLGISRDYGSYEGPVYFDVTMEMGGRLAMYTVRADMHLGSPHLTFVEARRISSVPGATAARPTTWGAIKKLYR